MLVKFICQNIFSINDEIEFRMFKSPTRVLKNHIYEVNDKLKILKTAIMYGANASGKTNFVRSINIGRSFIFGGPNNPNRIDIPVFKLESENKKETMFEYTFVSNKETYVYGYELKQHRVLNEWCYKLKGLKPVLLFERHTSDENNVKVEFGNFKRDDNSNNFFTFCIDATRHTQLFLTTLINNNSKHFQDIIKWFQNLTIIYPESKYGNLFNIIADRNFYQSFLEILNDLGIDIDDFEMKESLLADTHIDIPKEVIIKIKKNISPENSIHMVDLDGQYLIFSINRELHFHQPATYLSINVWAQLVGFV